MEVKFSVPGVPRPQGSKRHVGGGRMIEQVKGLGDWRARVSLAAEQAAGEAPLIDGPVHLQARFFFERPKSHYGSGRNAGVLKATAPDYPKSPPDLSKLVRAVEDAMTGIVYVDDARIVDLSGTCKLYRSPPGAEITVNDLTPAALGPA